MDDISQSDNSTSNDTDSPAIKVEPAQDSDIVDTPIVAKPVEIQEPVSQDFGQIEVQQYDAPHKRPLASLEETLGERPPDDLPGQVEKNESDTKVVNFRPAAMPPIKAANDNHTVTIATTFTIIILLAGFAAGFGGFKFLQNQTSSADTPVKAQETPKTIETESTTTETNGTNTTNSTADWSSYINTKYKYSLKYPDKWYSQGTESAVSNSIQLTSFKPDATATGNITSGYKIDIAFQDTNAKTLADWVEANNAAMNAKVFDSKKTNVSDKEAIQQTLTTPIKSIVTYVVHNNKIMMITYYAAETDFDQGISLYEDILNAISLNS